MCKLKILWMVLVCLITPFRLTFAEDETIRYSYDAMLRVTKVEYSDGTQIEYVYDNLGNRLIKNTSAGATANTPPLTPTNLLPVDDTTDVPLSPTFSWSGGDPDQEDRVIYSIFLGLDDALSLIWSGDASSSMTLSLQANTQYCWKVAATDSHNATTESAIQCFSTQDMPPIADFTSDATEGFAPLRIAFHDNSTSPTGCELMSWEWDFNGDGVIDLTGQNASYKYTEAGLYAVSLTVSNSCGSSNTVPKDAFVTVYDPGNTSISGRVTDSNSGDGIAGVTVYVRGPIQNHATTDTFGNYQITDLQPGDYKVYTSGTTGYADEYYPDTRESLADAIQVVFDQDIPNVDFVLDLPGSISGKVTDLTTNTVIAGVKVYALGNQGTMSATTDDSGKYTISGLDVEDYTVYTKDTDGYVDEYYNNVSNASLATQVSVNATENKPDIDFNLNTTGSISGRVTDENTGDGLADVTVRVSGPSYGYAITDDSGNYTISNLNPGNYMVYTSSTSGYVDEYYDNVLESATATSVSVSYGLDTPNIDFALNTPGSISGKVTDEQTGDELADVTVRVNGPSYTYTTTEADGTYILNDLKPGEYTVYTSSTSGYVDEYYNNVFESSTATLVSVNYGSDTPNIDFALNLPGSISGRVTDECTGDGLADVTVRIDGPSYGSVKTEEDGSYVIENLAPGDYTVYTAYTDGYVDEFYDNQLDESSATVVTVNSGVTTPDIDFALNTFGSISGRVSDESTTEGIAEASVYLKKKVYSSSSYTYVWAGSTSSDSAGNYLFEELEPGEYRVYVVVAGYAKEYYDNQTEEWYAGSVMVDFNTETTSIDFELLPSGSISGRVIDQNTQNGLENVRVYASGPSSKNSETDAEGYYVITDIDPGDYRVYTAFNGYGDEYYNNVYDDDEATRVSVSYGVATPDINFALIPSGSISGTVTDERTNLPVEGVWVHANGTSYKMAKTDVYGNYTITDLNPGEYVVSITSTQGFADEYYNNVHAESLATPISVGSDADTPDIDFALNIPGSISGRVLDEVIGQPISGISVCAKPTGWGYTCVNTGTDGNYMIEGLGAGEYAIYTRTPYSSSIDYADEYYNNQHEESQASFVSVEYGVDTAGINFELNYAGSISGQVVDETGTTLSYAKVVIERHTDEWYDYTDTDGNYTIEGLGAGDYTVYTSKYEYAGEYYDNVYNVDLATPVSVTYDTATSGIDFTLDLASNAPPGSISGTVTDKDTGLGIAGVYVIASGSEYESDYTDADGNYQITDLESGEYTVRFDATNYIEEYYNNAYDSSSATRIRVQPDTETSGIDVELEYESDNDDIPNASDNCPNTYNPSQSDIDGDGLGDACDPDADADGIQNETDNCVLVANADQTDADGNGYGDACQPVYHCVGSSLEFQQALDEAKDNDTHDVIQLVQGIYNVSENDSVQFSYSSGTSYDLLVLGGYTSACQDRVLNPTNTILDGENTTNLLYLGDWGSSKYTRLKIEGLTIQNGRDENYKGGGANLFSDTGQISVANNIFYNNSANYYGGSLYLSSNYGRILLQNNIITSNTAYSYGGGVYLSSQGETIFTNNTITENSIQREGDYGRGGGLYVAGSSQLSLYNNIFWENTASNSPAIYLSTDQDVVINAYHNNIDPAKVSGTFTNESGNITADPLFVDAISGNYHLSGYSPCIDAGDNAASKLPATDFEGEARSMGTAVDIGADEYYSSGFCSNVTEIPSGECQSLVSLYINTNGDNWLNTSDWLQTTTPCDWHGVTCEAGHVSKLDLHGNNLQGPLSSAIGELVFLKELILYSNYLTGAIPPEISNLTNLQGLMLSDNDFEGDLPAELRFLTNLKILWLGLNGFTGTIPTWLAELVNLERLDLGKTRLEGSVPTELGSLIKLQVLYLWDTPGLSGPLPLSLTNLAALQKFKFSGTGLCIPQDQAFQEWWLAGIPEVVGTDVMCTPCDGVTEIPQTECQALVAFAINTNVQNWLNHTGWLQTTTPCGWNGVVCANGHVTGLLLSGNNLQGSISPEIAGLSKLTHLNLSNNHLQGDLLPEIGSLRELLFLQLSSNQFTDTIPIAWSQLTKLTYLSLHSNPLTGTIPCEIGQMAALTQLNVFNTGLHGGIPMEVGNLANLQSLSLHWTDLEGNLPATLTNLTQLQSLYFNHTMLCAPQDQAFQTWFAGIPSVTGTGLLCPFFAEIHVRQDTTDILSGTGSYHFGTVNVGSSSAAITFIIENTGTADLTLSGITKGSSHPNDFTVMQPLSSTVTPGGSTTFTVKFTPAAAGTRTATISIANNDSDENPYTFAVSGTGQAQTSNSYILWTK